MLTTGKERGLTKDKLATIFQNNIIAKDNNGFFLYTINENKKVYFEQFYRFLEKVEKKCQQELNTVREELDEVDKPGEEKRAYLLAKQAILIILLDRIEFHYTDKTNLESIVSEWCFGTMVYEIVRDVDALFEYNFTFEIDFGKKPALVTDKIEQICRKTLLDIFKFPDRAFDNMWQYMDLVNRFKMSNT